MPKPKTDSIAQSLEQLEHIVRWLDDQEQVDVEEGLKKVKEGADLIRALRAKLKTVANEFEEVKKGLEEDEAS